MSKQLLIGAMKPFAQAAIDRRDFPAFMPSWPPPSTGNNRIHCSNPPLAKEMKYP